MSRPKEFAPEETNYDEAAVTEYIAGLKALERDEVEVAAAATSVKKSFEDYRKTYQARKLNTEAIDAVRKLMNSKSPAKRYAFLRTFDLARRLLNADDQEDMFPDHVDKGEKDAITAAA